MYGATNIFEVITYYFSNTIYLILFVLSVIYLFISQNKKGKLAIAAAIIVYFLLANDYVYRLFIRMDEGKTYYRNLWVIPYVAIIATAAIDLCRRVKRPIYRILVILIICTAAFISETVKPFIYYWNIPVNPQMVSNDVIELGDKLTEIQTQRKKRLFVVCPDSIRESLWLYNGDIQVKDASMFSTSERTGNEYLKETEPNVEHLMSISCSNGMDYIIIANTEKGEEVFQNQGYAPELKTNDYLLYCCYGYPGYTQHINADGQITDIAYYDEEGEPRTIYIGHHRVSYTYNHKGLNTRTDYFDKDGLPVIITAGYASIEQQFTDSGLLKSKKHLDTNNYPIMHNGYMETRYEYDLEHRLTRESYLDENEQLTNRSDLLYASKRFFYNNNTTTEEYYTKDNQKIMTSLGYASYSTERDNEGIILNESYYDTNGELLGDALEGQNSEKIQAFCFIHCLTDNVVVDYDGNIMMNTFIPNNTFNLVHLQLYDAKTGQYLTEFGNGKEPGVVSGQYCSDYPDGLYNLMLKGNTNLADARISCVVYLRKGSIIEYSYSIQELNPKNVAINNLNVYITETGDNS